MNHQELRQHKLTNLLHSTVLLGGMGALLALIGWIIAGAEGIVWTAAVGTLVLLLSPRISPPVLLRMYGARALDARSAPGLHALLEELSRRAGLAAVPRAFYLPSHVLNAFTMGTRDDAVVAISDGLLRALSARELAGVLAHELSHVRNNDMWVMSLADLVSRLTGLLSLAGQLMLLLTLPFMLFGDVPVPLLALAALIAAPTVSALLQLALSRTREYDADLDAAALTGDPRGLASALDKLERRQGGWIERILLPGRRLPEPSALRTHPPTAERIRRLLALAPAPAPGFGALRPLGQPVLHRAVPATRVRAPRWHVGGLWY